MIKIKTNAGLPPGDEPVWYRKAWRGVSIAWNTVVHSGLVSVPTSVAIAALEEQSPGAAYFWHCCLAASATPMMVFPAGICEVVADRFIAEKPVSRR